MSENEKATTGPERRGGKGVAKHMTGHRRLQGLSARARAWMVDDMLSRKYNWCRTAAARCVNCETKRPISRFLAGPFIDETDQEQTPQLQSFHRRNLDCASQAS